jgi:hypothetical protein
LLCYVTEAEAVAEAEAEAKAKANILLQILKTCYFITERNASHIYFGIRHK